MDPKGHDYTEITEWTKGRSDDTKPSDDYQSIQRRCNTLPAKPIPLPKPKVNKSSSVDRASPAAQRTGKLPMPLPRNDDSRPLPSLPTSATTKLPSSDPIPEEPKKVAKVTSQPYSLDTFYQTYQLPQFVSVVGGHLGVTEEYSMSEGEELVLFFVKTSQVVVASSERKSEWFYIPLNSSLQFVPNQYLPADENSVKGEDYFLQFKTVADLLNKKGEIPKVVKVCKTYNGRSAQSSVVAGELIFPQKVSVSFTRKKVLECQNSKNKLLKLELACEGNFSINPADVKLYLIELLHYFKEFPISAMVINDHVGRSKSSSLSTGTILNLDEPKQLQSYICSTDVHGKMKYPLMELPMSMPIEIECIEYPDFDMKPIYSKIQHTYENFRPSLIGKNMFNAQSTSMLATQQALYEEVQHDKCTTEVYDLEKPSLIYDSIPTVSSHSKDQDFHSTPAVNPVTPVVGPVTPVDTRPPLPPPRSNNAGRDSPLPLPRRNPPAAAKSSSAKHESAEVKINNPVASIDHDVSSDAAASVSSDTPGCAVNPTYISTSSADATGKVTLQTETIPNVGGTKEENIAYLKVLSLDKLLQLLENMNLGQYKDNFEEQQIDGEMIIHLDRADLADLGVQKNIHQTRLLKLIDGSISAKKYESGEYAFLKRKESLP